MSEVLAYLRKDVKIEVRATIPTTRPAIAALDPESLWSASVLVVAGRTATSVADTVGVVDKPLETIGRNAVDASGLVETLNGLTDASWGALWPGNNM